MGNKLKELLKFITNFKSTTTSMTLLLYNIEEYQCIIYYMLLELGQMSSSLVPLLLGTFLSTKGNVEMGINILADFGILEYHHIKQANIVTEGKTAGNLKVMGYLSRNVLGDCRGRLCGVFWEMFREWGWSVRKYGKRGPNLLKK
jgi:hypothetical protein